VAEGVGDLPVGPAQALSVTRGVPLLCSPASAGEIWSDREHQIHLEAGFIQGKFTQICPGIYIYLVWLVHARY
jgi:hypothetical protein